MHYRPSARGLPLVLALSGCADPGGAFDAFSERYRATHTADAGGDAGGDAGACSLPQPSQVAGQFVLLISPAFSPKAPILFLDEVSAKALGSDQIEVGMTLTALSATDRKTPVGAALAPVTASLDAGPFSYDLGVLEVVGAADPFIPGAAIEGSVVLHGQLCSAPEGPIDFWCGAVSGQVTAPVALDLAGSSWTLARVAPNGDLPELAVNCAKDPPDPL